MVMIDRKRSSPVYNMSILADTVLMIRPADFAYNEETAADNEFQHRPADSTKLRDAVLDEFERSVSQLRAAGIEVLVLEKSPSSVATPDAVFPNNWISTEPDGTVFLFPMCAPNRRAERKRYGDVEQLFRQAGLAVRNVVSIGPVGETRQFLEGTGSLCLDRRHRTVFAALSQRTDAQQLDNFVRTAGYENAITFHTRSSRAIEFYHTNVMLTIGDRFAIVCSQSVPDPNERQRLLSALERDREVVDISLQQTEVHFCGNCIHLKSVKGQLVIVMSRRALEGFTPEQRTRLERHGRLLPLPIDQIEQVGGGSARCMMAEVFLPRA